MPQPQQNELLVAIARAYRAAGDLVYQLCQANASADAGAGIVLAELIGQATAIEKRIASFESAVAERAKQS